MSRKKVHKDGLGECTRSTNAYFRCIVGYERSISWSHVTCKICLKNRETIERVMSGGPFEPKRKPRPTKVHLIRGCARAKSTEVKRETSNVEEVTCGACMNYMLKFGYGSRREEGETKEEKMDHLEKLSDFVLIDDNMSIIEEFFGKTEPYVKSYVREGILRGDYDSGCRLRLCRVVSEIHVPEPAVDWQDVG